MHHKSFTAVFIFAIATAVAAAETNSRSPYELLNRLEARDQNGVTELLKHIPVNTQFNPQGNTVLMTAIDMYAKRLAQRSSIEFEVGKAVACVAALGGCMATLRVPYRPMDEHKSVPNPAAARPANPPPPPAYVPQPQAQGHSNWRDPLGSVRLATDILAQTCARVNHLLDEFGGAIRVEAGRETMQAVEDAADAIKKASLEAGKNISVSRYYMQTGVLISCAAAAVWLGIKTLQNYLSIRKHEQRYQEDIALYESIIDELLSHQDLNFDITNDAGETVADLMRRLVMRHANDEEIMARLLTIERKILHAARGVHPPTI